MKRTNVVLDDALLDSATQELGFKTYSATINFALEEAVKMNRIRGLTKFFGSGLWEGDLSEMRQDAPAVRAHHG